MPKYLSSKYLDLKFIVIKINIEKNNIDILKILIPSNQTIVSV